YLFANEFSQIARSLRHLQLSHKRRKTTMLVYKWHLRVCQLVAHLNRSILSNFFGQIIICNLPLNIYGTIYLLYRVVAFEIEYALKIVLFVQFFGPLTITILTIVVNLRIRQSDAVLSACLLPHFRARGRRANLSTVYKLSAYYESIHRTNR